MRRIICGTLLAFFAVGAKAQAPPAQAGETVRTGTTEVLVDMVVRDKHGKIVRDIRPEEIQVFEDGVPQVMRHFELVEIHEPVGAGTTPAATPAPMAPASEPPLVRTLRESTIVSVVVGNLNPEGRRAAQEGVLEFVKNELRPNTYVGVFAWTYTGMKAVQWYTNDAARISDAMEQVVKRTYMAVPRVNSMGVIVYGDNQDPDILPDTTDDSGTASTGGSQAAASGPGAAAVAATNTAQAAATGPAAQIAMMMSTHWMSEYQDAYQASVRELEGVRSLVQAQAQLPGRKLVFLFAAGLTVHPDTIELLNSSISAANRANVTIYAIDTMRDTGQNLAGNRRLLSAAAASSRTQQLAGATGGNRTVTPDQVMVFENAARSVRADDRGNMREIAEATGGALLPVQDLEGPLHRAMEEVRTHYELTYSPAKLENDGRFRKIEVKVARPGVKVFARNGYYALPVLRGEEIYPFEMATLRAMNANPTPHQLAFHSAVLQFRPGARREQLALACEIPVRGLSVTEDKEWAKVHVAITALVKDAQGQVVEKLSKDLPYEVPSTKADELKRGVVSFTTPFRLSPGRYSLEIAAVDRDSEHAGVRRSVLVVPPAPDGLASSALVLARRVDPSQEPQGAPDPLLVRGGRVTPELSGVIDEGSGGDLVFYAVAYPPLPVDKPVRVAMEIRRDGQAIVQSADMDVPLEGNSTAPFVASFPRAKLSPGNYDAILTFSYGDQSAVSRTTFAVEAGESTAKRPL